MKNLLLLLSCIIVTLPTYAQMTSKSLPQDSVIYLTSAQEAFMIDKETTSLFKVGPLAYERKLSESLSINFKLQPTLIWSTESEINLEGFDIDSELEIRNYWKLPRLIKENKQANNLSSIYWGAGIGYSTQVGGIIGINTDEKRIYAVLGEQKRFLNFGYIDYGLKLDYAQSNNLLGDIFNFGRDLSGVRLSTFTNVGFAFGKRYELSEETKCPIFKCHLDRKSAFKINYNRTFQLYLGRNFNKSEGSLFSVILNPSIAYEYKIGNSSFSIDQDLEVNLYASNGTGSTFDQLGINFFRIKYSLGGRYYFNLKKNMRKGKSGNNLSGFYALARGTYHNSMFKSYEIRGNMGELTIFDSKGSYINTDVGIGYQKTVLNNVYFDIQALLPVRVKTFEAPSNQANDDTILEFKVGRFF